MNCDDLRLIELNSTATEMLSLLDGERTLDQIAAMMAEKYNQPLETVLTDITAIIEQLLELEIVTATPAATEQRL